MPVLVRINIITTRDLTIVFSMNYANNFIHFSVHMNVQIKHSNERGLSSLQQFKYSYQFLQMILKDIMAWYK